MDAPSLNEIEASKYITEAKANYHRYVVLREQGEFGWAVVLLFYSALHLVEAYKCIYHPNEVLDDHRKRLDYVYDELRQISIYYETLYSMSRHVRYYLYLCNEDKADYAHGDYILLWAEMQKLGITYEYS